MAVTDSGSGNDTQSITSTDYLRLIAKSGLRREHRDYLRTLLTWADLETWECWPSVTTIADAMGIDERTARRFGTDARALGLIDDVGVMKSGQYRLRINVEGLRSLVDDNDEEGGHDAPHPRASCPHPPGITPPPPGRD
ncbi:MAG: helix-turn-helix domain-containing protein, partial [Planctomycetota bacterium]